MKVGELCVRTVIVADGDETVVDAAQRMRTAHVGTLVVVEDRDGGRRPLGIVTDRDLLFAITGTTPERAASVRTGPADTAFTRMFFWPRSQAR